MTAQRYSQRMLNPFHGMVNVVEIPGADAVTRDGVSWTLYIQGGTETEQLGDGSSGKIPLPDIKFGSWTRAEGLRRAPVRYVTDYQLIDAVGNRLLEEVKQAIGRLPFSQRDWYELWLLDDRDALPLALLQSRCHCPDEARVEVPRWRVGQRVRADQGPQRSDWPDRLVRLVNGAAGGRPRAQWFLRGQQGGGDGLACSDRRAGLEGRWLAAHQFPELLLRRQWESAASEELVTRYLEWQAPWLLALQTLSREVRAWLEQQACRQALRVAELHHSYPELIDAAAIQAARVEARLRLAAGDTHAAAAEPDPESTFFVTGN